MVLQNKKLRQQKTAETPAQEPQANPEAWQQERHIRQILIEKIDPSPYQMRRVFDPAQVEELAESIRQNGLLQPVTVQRTGGGRYCLIAGERRLRACKLAGYTTISAIVCTTNPENGALLGYIENQDRKDLDCFDQAHGLQLLQNLWGCSQEKAAARLGLSQSAFCNKLRLLQLSEEEQQLCRSGNLTERHARAVLRLPAGEQRTGLLALAGQQQWSVSYLEQQVKLALQANPPKSRRFMVRDVRLFLNTVDKAIQLMNQAGVHASATRTQQEEYMEYHIRIPLKEFFSRR